MPALVPEGEPESVLGVRWENGEPRFDYAPEPTALTTAVAWSPDGLLLALGDAAGRVHIRAAATTTNTDLLLVHACSTRVNAVDFSPDGNTLATGCDSQLENNVLRLWNSHNGAAHCQRFGHEEGVVSLAFSADGKVIASGRKLGTVRLWDTVSGAELGTLGSSNHEQVSSSLRGALFATWGMGDSSVYLWDMSSRRQVQQLPGHELFVTAVAFNRDGKSLVAVGTTDSVRHWDTESGKALNPLWNAEQRSALSRLATPSSAYKAIAFSPDGKAVALTLGDSVIRVLDTRSGELLLTIPGHSKLITVIKWSPDGRRIASLSQDKTVRLWDSVTGTALERIDGYSSGARVIAWSPDAQSLAVGGDRVIRIWRQRLDQPPLSMGPRGNLVTLGFSDDGKALVSKDESKLVQYWDASSGKELTQDAVGPLFRDYEAWVKLGFHGHALSPDGKTLATVDPYGRAVVLWDSVSRQTRVTLSGSEQAVNSVAFSPDSRFIAAGSDDGVIRVWDANAGKLIQQLEAHFPRLNGTALDWSRDGTLVAAGEDQAVRFWRFQGKTLKLDAVLWANALGWVIWRANAPPNRRVLRGETGSERHPKIGRRGNPKSIQSVVPRPHLTPTD